MSDQDTPKEAVIADVDKFNQYVFQIYHILEKLEALVKQKEDH